MAENEFDKTVKLPSSGSSPGSNDKTAQITPLPDDKTVRLTPPLPQEDKTVQLSPSMDATVRLTPPASPVPAPMAPASPVLLAPSAPPPPRSGRAGSLKKLALPLGAAVLVFGGAWYGLPLWLKSSAENLSKQGNHLKAAQRLEWALMLRPLRCDAYLPPLGRAQRLSQDYTGAQKSLEQFLARNPNDFEANKELGLAYREAGQSQKAFEAFQKCAQARPDDADAAKWGAQLAFELKNYKDAAVLHEMVRKAGKSSGDDLYQLGAAQAELGHIDASVDALQAAVKENSQLKGVHGLLGKGYGMQNKWSDAAEAYAVELALAPSAALSAAYAGACLNAANLFLSQKKDGDALKFLQEGLKVKSDREPELHYRLAGVSSKQRKNKEALQHLAEAVRADAALKPRARKDPAFASLRRLPAFQKLTK